MLRITAAVRDEMFAHALRALPNEACGMFSSARTGLLVDEFHAMSNAAASDKLFRLDGQELLDVEAVVHQAGREVRGVMHSHPVTSAYPSPTDIDAISTFDPQATLEHIIVSLRNADPVLRCFQIVDGAVVEVLVTCDEDEPTADDGSPAVAMAAVQRLPQPGDR